MRRPYGYLIFGVSNDTHRFVGTNFNYLNLKQGNEEFTNWLERLLNPRINVTFHTIKYSEICNVVVVEIPSAFGFPVRFKGQAYIRIGSSKKRLEDVPGAQKALWNALDNIDFEQATAIRQDLHFDKVKMIAERKHIPFHKKDLETLCFKNRSGMFNNLGYLFSDENEIIVKFAVYDEHINFKVKKEFSGSWLMMLDQVLEYADLYNTTSARVIGSDHTRTELRSYPEPSLRENICNAFCHLELRAPSNIKIEFFVDHCEIASPGPLFYTTLKEVMKGRQSFRNPGIIKVLNHFDYIENYATGFKKTEIAYLPYDYKPEYIASEHFFTVILPNLNYYNGLKDNVVESVVENVVENDMKRRLKEIERKIIDIIRDDEYISAFKIATELSISSRTVQRYLKRLQDKCIIIRIGGDKGGHWKIKE